MILSLLYLFLTLVVLCMCTGLVWWCSYVFRWVAVFCVAVLSARERERKRELGGWRVAGVQSKCGGGVESRTNRAREKSPCLV